MPMIEVFAKKALRFPKPDVNVLALKEGEKFEAAFFQTKPNEVQQAPDWIMKDNLWALALKDGDIKLTQGAVSTSAKVSDDQKAADDKAAAKKAADDKTAADAAAKKAADDKAKAGV